MTVTNKKWFPFNKGGEYRKWYGNFDYVINWENDGFELRNFASAAIRNSDFYFHPHVTWSKISSGVVSFRYRQAGSIFSDAGCAALFQQEDSFYMLALLNSKYAQKVFDVINPTLNYTQSTIANLPCIIDNKRNVNAIALDCLDITQTDWDSFETSWDFKRHPLVPKLDKDCNDGEN